MNRPFPTVNRMLLVPSLRRALLPTLLVAVAACSGGGTEPPKPPTDHTYTVEVRWVGTPPAGAIAQAFTDAATRIGTMIVADLQDAQIGSSANPFNITECNAFLTGVTPLNELVDDVIIFAQVTPIDGPGQVLGSAGPCLTRTTNGLTGLGTMRFDSADLDNLNNNGRLKDVILHEMLHIVGIGTLWTARGLLADKDSATVRVTGPLAAAACANELGGGTVCVGSVPAENCLDLPAGVVCGAGTQNAHWKESTFKTELMTGYAGATNSLSKMTIQGLADLGYTVNTAVAEAYVVPAFTAAVAAGATAELRAGGAAEPRLVEPDIALPAPLLPRFAVDPAGRVHRIVR